MVDILKKVADADKSGVLNTGMAVLTGLNMIKSNERANSASNQQAALTAAEIARNERIMSLYESGSREMRAAIEAAYKNFGGFDQISATQFDSMRGMFSNARELEELQNASQVVDRSTGYQNTFINDESRFRSNATSRYNQGRSEQDEMIARFADLRNQNTDRAVAEARARASAKIPEGLENSTYAIQMEKSLTDMEAQAYNQNLIDAMTDAQTYIKGNLDYSTNRSASDIAGGRYGMEFADGKIGMYGGAIDDTKSLQSMRNNTYLNDYVTGLDTMNNTSTVFRDYATSKGNEAAGTFKFAADGTNLAGFDSALTSASNTADRMSDAADAAGGSFGTWLDRATDYNPITGTTNKP
tara:strand:- start:4155 stop:5222 length:1068 start_codon:yes stop_codon:yes gene_type:complete